MAKKPMPQLGAVISFEPEVLAKLFGSVTAWSRSISLARKASPRLPGSRRT